MVAIAFHVIGKTNARAEVLGIVTRHFSGQTGRDGIGRRKRQQLLVRAALGRIHARDHVEIPVITEPDIQGQALHHLPVVLEVETKLLGPVRDDKGRIAVGDAHGFDRAGSGEAVRECSQATTRGGGVGRYT